MTYSLPDALVGALYFVLPALVLVVYTPCIVVLIKDPELKNLSCLRIMAHMGLTDVIQLFGYMLCGFWQITGLGWNLPYWLNRIATTYTIMSGWWNYIFLANILGFNRLLARVYPAYEQRVFSYKATTVWLSVVWLNTGLWLIYFTSPYAGMIYHPQIFSFFYDTQLKHIELTMKITFAHCVFHTALTTLSYCIIVIATMFELNGLSSISEELRARERSLLLQSVIICSVLAVADQYFHNISGLLYPLLGRYTYVLSNFLFICMSGCNPFVYLTFNKTVREKVKHLVGVGQQPSLFNAQAVPTNHNQSKRNDEQVVVEDME